MYLEGIVKVFVLEKPILLEKEKQFELQHEGILYSRNVEDFFCPMTVNCY